MTFAEIIIVFFIALLIAAVFSYGFKSPGPWGGFWIFLLLLFLVAWAARLWVTPAGPIIWGFAWIPIFFVVLLFALLIAAASGAGYTPREDLVVEQKAVDERTEEAKPAAAFGIFFWFLIIILIIAIIIGSID